jgi:hypothetical protein
MGGGTGGHGGAWGGHRAFEEVFVVAVVSSVYILLTLE